jgi:lipopolysaccharide transport system ATP-binding protein
MSSDEISIRVSGISKRYEIYKNPLDRLKQFLFPKLSHLFKNLPISYFEEFWALKDICFEVKKGETVGIIGSNGSGKSTLLQLICGTLSPTNGDIQVNGRVAALLELGSGFNPEFTGRENVYLNAAILGLTKSEIDQRFDEITSFADIGSFIDQPVKIYSSGMYVRLAFAVIAHVDADILVIDEALAVGDMVFIQKCMRFIRQFQKSGTLLFVSHDAAAIQSLCSRGIWLNNGRTELIGSSKKVSESYLEYSLQKISGEEQTSNSKEVNPNPPNIDSGDDFSSVINYDAVNTVSDNIANASGWRTGKAEILSINFSEVSSGMNKVLQGGEVVRVRIRAKAYEDLPKPIIGFVLRDRLGQDLFGENTLSFTDITELLINGGQEFEGVFEFILPMLPNGQYALMASVANGSLFDNVQHHWMNDALVINVSSSKVRYGVIGIPFRSVDMRVIDGYEII